MRRRRLPSLNLPAALWLGLGWVAIVLSGAAAASIDPDPRSPTLGEILDDEARAQAPMPPPPVRNVRSEPVIPPGAVTVWAPGVRPRPKVRR